MEAVRAVLSTIPAQHGLRSEADAMLLAVHGALELDGDFVCERVSSRLADGVVWSS